MEKQLDRNESKATISEYFKKYPNSSPDFMINIGCSMKDYTDSIIAEMIDENSLIITGTDEYGNLLSVNEEV